MNIILAAVPDTVHSPTPTHALPTRRSQLDEAVVARLEAELEAARAALDRLEL
ncbi:hypothetical protein [Nocardia salmonicida]|uniref:hypothetical protein n=1 Tax=Nocardia salmonicida TaxID=53431 RepID=UPI0037B4E5EC